MQFRTDESTVCAGDLYHPATLKRILSSSPMISRHRPLVPLAIRQATTMVTSLQSVAMVMLPASHPSRMVHSVKSLPDSICPLTGAFQAITHTRGHSMILLFRTSISINTTIMDFIRFGGTLTGMRMTMVMMSSGMNHVANEHLALYKRILGWML